MNWVVAICAVLFFCSCEKQLNVFPTTSEVDGTVITDVKSAKAVLNGIYYRFANVGTNYLDVPVVQWSDANEVPSSLLSNLVISRFGGNALADHTVSPVSYETAIAWNYSYNIINAANGFLKNISPVTSIGTTTKNEMIAEAKFLRAYANANLLLYYGQYTDMNSPYGNLLRNEFVTSENIAQPRSGVAQTYDSVLADIDFAITNLPDRNTSIIYANKWVAELMKARLLINRNANGDNAEVIRLTKDIIANSSFNLEENVRDIFWNKNITSSEVMMGVQPNANQTVKYNAYAIYGNYAASDSLAGLFANDPRSSWVYQDEADPFFGGVLHEFTKYNPGDASAFSPQPVSEYSYAFRLTEAYLLEAEAIVASGGDMNEAKSLVKTVLTHAGYTSFTELDAANTASDLQLYIIKETMKSFVGEAGQDWLAVRRLSYETITSFIPAIKSKDNLLLPIPQDEINNNTKMIQNPGY